jgi:hypothetical protein
MNNFVSKRIEKALDLKSGSFSKKSHKELMLQLKNKLPLQKSLNTIDIGDIKQRKRKKSKKKGGRISQQTEIQTLIPNDKKSGHIG